MQAINSIGYHIYDYRELEVTAFFNQTEENKNIPLPLKAYVKVVENEFVDGGVTVIVQKYGNEKYAEEQNDDEGYVDTSPNSMLGKAFTLSRFDTYSMLPVPFEMNAELHSQAGKYYASVDCSHYSIFTYEGDGVNPVTYEGTSDPDKSEMWLLDNHPDRYFGAKFSKRNRTGFQTPTREEVIEKGFKPEVYLIARKGELMKRLDEQDKYSDFLLKGTLDYLSRKEGWGNRS